MIKKKEASVDPLVVAAGGSVVTALPRQQCIRARAAAAAKAAWLRHWQRQLSGRAALAAWWRLRQLGGACGSASALVGEVVVAVQ